MWILVRLVVAECFWSVLSQRTVWADGLVSKWGSGCCDSGTCLVVWKHKRRKLTLTSCARLPALREFSFVEWVACLPSAGCSPALERKIYLLFFLCCQILTDHFCLWFKLWENLISLSLGQVKFMTSWLIYTATLKRQTCFVVWSQHLLEYCIITWVFLCHVAFLFFCNFFEFFLSKHGLREQNSLVILVIELFKSYFQRDLFEKMEYS